jgi:hypothetical protein
LAGPAEGQDMFSVGAELFEVLVIPIQGEYISPIVDVEDDRRSEHIIFIPFGDADRKLFLEDDGFDLSGRRIKLGLSVRDEKSQAGADGTNACRVDEDGADKRENYKQPDFFPHDISSFTKSRRILSQKAE